MVTLNENLPIISLNKIRKLTGERVLFYLITEKFISTFLFLRIKQILMGVQNEYRHTSSIRLLRFYGSNRRYI